MIFLVFLAFSVSLSAQVDVRIVTSLNEINVTSTKSESTIIADSLFYFIDYSKIGVAQNIDTVAYTIKNVIGRKNIVSVKLLFSNFTINLHNKLHDNIGDKDSIINEFLRKFYCDYSTSRMYRPVSCEVTDVQWHNWKYPYVNIYHTGLYSNGRELEYISRYSRLYIVDYFFYLISVETHNERYMNSARCSRKAVQRDFMKIIKTIEVID
jgi:hypothetical protein